MPTAIYTSDKDFVDGALISEAIHARVGQAVEEAARVLGRSDPRSIAA